MTYCIIHGKLPCQSSPTSLGDTQNMNSNKASAKSRLSTFVQASGLNLSSTLMGKVETKMERANHGFRSVAPWRVPVVDVHAWLQKYLPACNVDDLSVGQMRRFHIRRIVVGKDGIRRVLYSEPQLVDSGNVDTPRAWSQYLESVGLRNGRVVEVICSFA